MSILKGTIGIFIFFCLVFHLSAQNISVDGSLETLKDVTFKLEAPKKKCRKGNHDEEGDLLNLPKDMEFKKNSTGGTWARTLRFRTKFSNDCKYNLGNHNQKDWNKLMQISETVHFGRNSIRLGWRYNLEKGDNGKMELGLYGHINHTGDKTSSEVGREFLYLADIDLDVNFNSELIFGAGGIGAIVNNKGTYIKRNLFHEGTTTTSYLKNAYFGGQECPPHDMEIFVKRIHGDLFTNWHDGACEKTFSRSIFYSYENLNIYAAHSIAFSEQVYRGQYDKNSKNAFSNTIPVDKSHGDEIPWYEKDGERYVRIESGSSLQCNAGEEIRLLPGFHAMPGSYFKATIDPYIACEGFKRSSGEEEDEDIDEEDEEIVISLNSESEIDEDLVINNVNKEPVNNFV
jgi:hypothetical protein